MSRRKQSNPKPIKRPEDEDDEGDGQNKTSQSDTEIDVTDQSDASNSDSEFENEPIEMEDMESEEKDRKSPCDQIEMDDSENMIDKDTNDKETVIKSELDESIDMSPRCIEMMAKLRFPSELLTLRKVAESEFQHTGIPWSVSSAVDLPKGTKLGPYQGELVALSSIKPRELVLQFQGGDGDFSFIRVMEEQGAWLSLLKPAEHSATYNTQVLFEGGKIWCEIVEDLKQGVELAASFTTKIDPKTLRPISSPAAKSVEQTLKDIRTAGGKKSDAKSLAQLSPQHALIYGCPFCCVRFSSRRTLDAHLTYYCSKKPPDFVSLQQLHQHLQQQAQSILEKQIENQSKQENGLASPQVTVDPESPKGSKRTAEEAGLESPENSADSDTPRQKSPKSGEIFQCPSCSYVTEKLSSFQRHRLAHAQQQKEDGAVSSERLSASPVCQEEAFCKECNIQFSSISTYKGHKEFYCRFELAKQGNGENIEGASSAGLRQMDNELSPKLLKSPNMFVEKNGHLASAKARIPSELLTSNLLTTPLLLQAMSSDMQLLMRRHSSGDVLKSMKPEAKQAEIEAKPTEDQPLDLSKTKPGKDEDTVERDGETDTDGKASVKAEPTSPSHHKSDSSHHRDDDKLIPGQAVSPIRPPLNIPTVHPTLVGGAKIQYVNKKPIPPLQSVSRCVECNIVFYKHENYLIHKEHYCSGRRTGKDTSSESESEGKTPDRATPLSNSTLNMKSRSELGTNVSPIEEPAVGEVKTPDSSSDVIPGTKTDLYYKYYCYPCKIRFSSAGTLKAHKDFYCPHGKENNMFTKDSTDNDDSGRRSGSNYHCDNCKNEFLSARLLKLHICMPEVSPVPLQRCLYCDYVTQTENRLSEHMKVHVPTKAFKCNLCGYRGNTARGMRMHGKTHIESGEDFTDENMIEYEEPPLVPIQRNGLCEKGPVDVETELIRMKNEPYKRRRSRKSFEKSENMVPFLSPSLLTQICAACGQTFSNVSEFVIHLKMHEIAALEALKSLRCEHCTDYIADSLTSLLIHMQTKHPEQLPGTSRHEHEPTSGSEGERSRSRGSHISTDDRSRSNSVESSKMSHCSQDDPKTRSPDSKIRQLSHDQGSPDHLHENHRISNGSLDHIKQEAITENDGHYFDGRRSIKIEKDLVQNDKSQSTDPSSKSSELSQSPVMPNPPDDHGSRSQSVSPHLEPQSSPRPTSSPSSTASNPSQSPKLSSNSTVKDVILSPKIENIKQEHITPKRLSPDPKTRYLMSQNSSTIKQEQMSPPADKPLRKVTPPVSPRTPSASPKLLTGHTSPSSIQPPLSLLYNPASLLPLYHLPPGISSLIPNPDLQHSPPAHSSLSEKPGRKYCKHCDINFTYLSSFLTHKKYYCSARNTTEDTQSPTATA